MTTIEFQPETSGPRTLTLIGLNDLFGILASNTRAASSTEVKWVRLNFFFIPVSCAVAN